MLRPGQKRLLGVGIALVCAVGLVVIYETLPSGQRFPVVYLALPALAVAAGIFQAITGMTLPEANEGLSSMTPAKRVGVAGTLIALLLGVIGVFYWFATPARR